jgi:hypothetical protein
VSINHRLAFDVAASLRRDLILEHDAGEPGIGVTTHRPLDVLCAAEPGVTVADQWYRHGAANVPTLIDHLGIGDQPGVGHAETRSRYREAAHEAELEAGLFDQTRRHRIMAAGHHQQPRSLQQRAETIGGSGHGVTSSAPAEAGHYVWRRLAASTKPSKIERNSPVR